MSLSQPSRTIVVEPVQVPASAPVPPPPSEPSRPAVAPSPPAETPART